MIFRKSWMLRQKLRSRYELNVLFKLEFEEIPSNMDWMESHMYEDEQP